MSRFLYTVKRETQDGRVQYVGYDEDRNTTKIPDALYRDIAVIRLEKYSISQESRVAVIGDIHGGLCNLCNFVKRLVASGFFYSTTGELAWVLKPHHYIVSLGDLVDRGPYSLEVVELLFHLKVRNWNEVYIINGNHEDANQYSSLVSTGSMILNNQPQIRYIHSKTGDTLFTQFGEPDDKARCSYIFIPFNYLPAAVFLRFGTGRWSQYCHGGIDEDIQDSIEGFLEETNVFSMIELHNSFEANLSGLKWSDFKDNDTCREPQTSPPSIHAGPCGEYSERGAGHIYSRPCTDRYLEELDLECIIRGHQDFVNGFMVLPRGKKVAEGSHLTCTACLYPVSSNIRPSDYKKSGSCKDKYREKHAGVDTDKFIHHTVLFLGDESDSGLIQGRVDWETIRECSVPERPSYTDSSSQMMEGSYQLCVPRGRCEVFKKMFAPVLKPSRYQFTTEDISVITTATCQEARGNLVESWLLITAYSSLSSRR